MPQLLLIGVVCVVAWLGYRAFLREAEKVHKQVRRAEQERQNRAHGTLVQDPKTGEYRLPKDPS